MGVGHAVYVSCGVLIILWFCACFCLDFLPKTLSCVLTLSWDFDISDTSPGVHSVTVTEMSEMSITTKIKQEIHHHAAGIQSMCMGSIL